MDSERETPTKYINFTLRNKGCGKQWLRMLVMYTLLLTDQDKEVTNKVKICLPGTIPDT